MLDPNFTLNENSYQRIDQLRKPLQDLIKLISADYDESICKNFVDMIYSDQIDLGPNNDNFLIRRVVFESQLGISSEGSKKLDDIINSVFIRTDTMSKLISKMIVDIRNDIDDDIIKGFIASKECGWTQ